MTENRELTHNRTDQFFGDVCWLVVLDSGVVKGVVGVKEPYIKSSFDLFVFLVYIKKTFNPNRITKARAFN